MPFSPLRPLTASLALLLPLAAAPAAAQDDGAADAAIDAITTENEINARAAGAEAPPSPPLAPSQPYRPLNFYTREELRAFPRESVPSIAPWCGGAYVAPPLPRLEGDDRGVDSPVYVAASRMQLDENGESQVSGAVEVRHGQNMMRAEHAAISAARDKVLLEGNVYLQDPAMTLEAERAELTLNGSGSHIRAARYALHAPNIRGSADAINREDMYRVEIEGGAYTTCEPGSAAWMLAAHRIRLDQEAGWGSASHVRLLVQDLPVLYVPYITFPIDKRRRTGVLYPTFTFSDSDGTDIGIPYYFNLAPQYDLLLTPRWIEERGTLAEASLRYLHGAPQASLGTGELGIGWIGRDALYGDQPRYLLRYAHNGAPGDGWRLYADATEVSDNDYLDDLATTLSVNRESHLLRLAQARYTADRWSALARVQAYQTIDPTVLPADQPYRRLPQLQLAGSQPAGAGAEWTGLGEYTWFTREIDTPTPVGARLRVEPGLRLPFTGASHQLEAAVRLRHASYTLDDNPADETPQRTIPTASLDGTLFLERPFRLFGNDWTQTLEPRVFALWTPYENQDDIPLFDTTALTFGYEQLFRDNRFIGGDRIGDAEQISLALESRFVGPDGAEAARIGIGQATYAADRRVQLAPTDPVETNRYSPFVAHALWQVAEQWNARAEGQWSPDNRDFVRGSLRANWQDSTYRTLNVAYRYDDPGIDQAELSGLLPVDARWNLVGRWVFDLETARSMEALGGFEYESCCWRARLLARRTLDIDTSSGTLVPEEGVVFQIELKGLGSLGDQVDVELAETIPGYENRSKAQP